MQWVGDFHLVFFYCCLKSFSTINLLKVEPTFFQSKRQHSLWDQQVECLTHNPENQQNTHSHHSTQTWRWWRASWRASILCSRPPLGSCTAPARTGSCTPSNAATANSAAPGTSPRKTFASWIETHPPHGSSGLQIHADLTENMIKT